MKAGGVAALVGNLGSGQTLPASIVVLRALHGLVSPDPSGGLLHSFLSWIPPIRARGANLDKLISDVLNWQA